MDYNQLYSKYYSRMSKEGWIKSLFCALAIGFAVNGIIALVTWLAGFDAGIWIALGGLVVATAAAMPVFYSLFFCPNEKSVAKRLDSLGLDERIITMQELQGDTSEIACLQRADASDKVEQTERAAQKNGKVVKMKITIAPIIAVACAGVFGLSFSIVTALSGYGGIPSGKYVLNGAFFNSKTYSVKYGIFGEEEKNDDAEVKKAADKKRAMSWAAYALASLTSEEEDKGPAGHITKDVAGGATNQKVKEGGSSEQIYYTANDYYYFVRWLDNFGNKYGCEDGYTPTRYEENVKSDIELKIQFEKVEECKTDGKLARKFADGEGEGSFGPGGGQKDPGNQDYELNRYDYIIDGLTKYMTDYDMYYDLAMKYLSSDPESISAEERAMIETYFGTLK